MFSECALFRYYHWNISNTLLNIPSENGGHDMSVNYQHSTLLIIEFPLSLVLRIVHLLLLTCLLLLITINNDDICVWA